MVEFEFDGETGYFYLYDQTREATQRIVDQIRALNRRPKFAKNEVVVRWDGVERMVGLTIQGKVWAVFDGEARTKYGGDYSPNAVSTVPAEIANRFTG